MQTQEAKNTRYVSGVTSYIVDGSDDFILVDTSVNAVAIYLPNVLNSGILYSPKNFYITDNTGNASTHNITIYPSGNDQINGGASFVISTNGETAECIVASNIDWLTISDSGGAGGGGVVTTISYDLLGTDTIDMTGRTGEFIVNLSNSTTPSTGVLNIISNFSAVTKMTIRPVPALTLTVNDAIVSGSASIKLYAPTLPLYGQYFGFLTLELRSAAMYQINYIDQYNSTP